MPDRIDILIIGFIFVTSIIRFGKSAPTTASLSISDSRSQFLLYEAIEQHYKIPSYKKDSLSINITSKSDDLSMSNYTIVRRCNRSDDAVFEFALYVYSCIVTALVFVLLKKLRDERQINHIHCDDECQIDGAPIDKSQIKETLIQVRANEKGLIPVCHS